MTAERRRRWRRVPRSLAAMGLAVLLAVGPGTAAQAVSYEQIEGTGSTWSANAISQWTRDVQQYGNQVVYTATGSSAGRKNFAQYQNDFGVSEIPYQGTDPVTGEADNSTRPYAYMPIVAGGTAFMYQIRVNGQLYRDLRLSGDTIAKIFTNQITKWNDPAITADNNGKALPALDIIPVVRSDGSGTTAQFTTWMDKRQTSRWRGYCGCRGLLSYYPRKGRQVARSGSDQVADFVAADAGNGTIGYVEYSYARNKNYPVAKMLNEKGFYVLPTDYNVAVALTKAEINQNRSDPRLYLTQVLDKVYVNNDPRAYPLSSYSYMILPTAPNDQRLTAGKAKALADFAYYFLCEGQKDAGALGYSPLPRNLVAAGFDQVKRISKLNPADLTNKNIGNCPNPTFDSRNPNSNKLAAEAPMPPACDEKGKGPCSGGGGSSGSGNGTGSGNGSGNGNGTGNGTGTDADGDGVPDGGAPVDTDGDGVADNATGAEANGTVLGSATELAGFRSDGMSTALAVIAGVELLLVMIVPALIGRRLGRDRGEGK